MVGDQGGYSSSRSRENGIKAREQGFLLPKLTTFLNLVISADMRKFLYTIPSTDIKL